MRAWIETLKETLSGAFRIVALRVRAWIETVRIVPRNVECKVALRVRAWIETLVNAHNSRNLLSPSA